MKTLGSTDLEEAVHIQIGSGFDFLCLCTQVVFFEQLSWVE
jgi:hypothetical protein